MPTENTNDYRFGYSRDEIERLGDQHRIWAEDNQRFLARAGFDVELHVVTKAVRVTTPEWRWPDAVVREHLAALVDEGYRTREVLDPTLCPPVPTRGQLWHSEQALRLLSISRKDAKDVTDRQVVVRPLHKPDLIPTTEGGVAP